MFLSVKSLIVYMFFTFYLVFTINLTNFALGLVS